jgi:beta-galactosidase
MDKLLYGIAYYDEYMPYERLDKDIQMMKDAGINVVRIAESTWSTHEPQNGVFDFSSVDRVLDAMHEAGIQVIVGTPTYAVPTWMVKEHPDVLATTSQGPGKWRKTDHGYYTSNLSILCRADHPQADLPGKRTSSGNRLSDR